MKPRSKPDINSKTVKNRKRYMKYLEEGYHTICVPCYLADRFPSRLWDEGVSVYRSAWQPCEICKLTRSQKLVKFDELFQIIEDHIGIIGI